MLPSKEALSAMGALAGADLTGTRWASSGLKSKRCDVEQWCVKSVYAPA